MPSDSPRSTASANLCETCQKVRVDGCSQGVTRTTGGVHTCLNYIMSLRPADSSSPTSPTATPIAPLVDRLTEAGFELRGTDEDDNRISRLLFEARAHLIAQRVTLESRAARSSFETIEAIPEPKATDRDALFNSLVQAAFDDLGNPDSRESLLRRFHAASASLPSSIPAPDPTPKDGWDETDDPALNYPAVSERRPAARVVCKTKAEWDVAYRSWKEAGCPGGRLGRPVLDSITTCEKCGGAKMEPELMPAFPHKGNWCRCIGEETTDG